MKSPFTTRSAAERPRQPSLRCMLKCKLRWKPRIVTLQVSVINQASIRTILMRLSALISIKKLVHTLILTLILTVVVQDILVVMLVVFLVIILVVIILVVIILVVIILVVMLLILLVVMMLLLILAVMIPLLILVVIVVVNLYMILRRVWKEGFLRKPKTSSTKGSPN